MLKSLTLWMDHTPRPGPEAMAVDEWLWETAVRPVLRVYRWSGNWGSIGCFGNLGEARAALPGLEWVRRWTGGGTVDHRHDWTYTLAIPAGEPLASMRGAESYHIIHRALAKALASEGCGTRLADDSPREAGGLCFIQPVEHDLLDATGRKIAGAGQRRNRTGLLHQGSVALPMTCSDDSTRRARRLADALAEAFVETQFHPPEHDLCARTARRYANPEWTARR